MSCNEEELAWLSSRESASSTVSTSASDIVSPSEMLSLLDGAISAPYDLSNSSYLLNLACSPSLGAFFLLGLPRRGGTKLHCPAIRMQLEHGLHRSHLILRCRHVKQEKPFRSTPGLVCLASGTCGIFEPLSSLHNTVCSWPTGADLILWQRLLSETTPRVVILAECT